MPEFPSGQASLLKYLATRIKYPAIAQENGIQGRVSCSFVVDTDGSLKNIEVIRGIDPSLDREAVRVIREIGDPAEAFRFALGHEVPVGHIDAREQCVGLRMEPVIDVMLQYMSIM